MTPLFRFAILLVGTFALSINVADSQTGSGETLWEIHHPHDLKKESSATARLTASDDSGRTVGSFGVTATCAPDLISIRAVLSGPPGLEIVRAPKTYAAQVEHRSAIIVTLGGHKPIATTSLLDDLNTVNVLFTAPGIATDDGAAVGALVLSQTINGSMFIGDASDLYGASSFRLDALAKRSSSSSELVHFTFSPQDPSFQAFAKSCNELLPGHEPDPHILLTERADEAATYLPRNETLQLRSILATFEDAVKTNNYLAMNEAPTKVLLLAAFGADKRCGTREKRSCDAAQALSDVRDAMSLVRGKADTKRIADTQAEKTLIPANSTLKLVFPEQVDISSGARGEQITAHLATALNKGNAVMLEQGAVFHLAVSTLGTTPRQVIADVKDVVRNGVSTPIHTTQCLIDVTTDTAPAATQRPMRLPGQPPFRPAQRSLSPSSHIAAGSMCSVEVARALMR